MTSVDMCCRARAFTVGWVYHRQTEVASRGRKASDDDRQPLHVVQKEENGSERRMRRKTTTGVVYQSTDG